jgi:lysophospholipase L1-like esterase
MGRASLALVFVALGACGNVPPYANAQATPPASNANAAPPAIASTTSVTIVTASDPETPHESVSLLESRVGSLDHATALKHFFESLARLEAGHEHDDVHIVQFGDSHTAADIAAGVARRALQARFGDGGRGFVAIGKSYNHYLQSNVRVGMSPDWEAQHGKLVRGHFAGDGEYGLAGMSIETTKSGARAWSDVNARASRVEVDYLAQPGGGSFDLFVDGAKTGRIRTNAKMDASAFRSFDVPETAHHIEARTVGDGDVRLFGIALDRSQVGVTFDALGINGARYATALQWNEAHMAEQLQHRAPSLIILAYGTNESGDETSAATFERQIVDLLGRMARAVPSASCMLLGPPDRAIQTPTGWATSPKILDRIQSEERVAAAAGCAFYDQMEAMGGSDSIARWAEETPPRAQRDRVHMTQGGYDVLGGALAADVIHAYSIWRQEQHLPAAAPRVSPTSNTPPSSPDARRSPVAAQ